MMQPALLVDEILRHIFQYASEPETLSALARSCRAWSDPALDYLWIRLSSIAPLLNLIEGAQVVNGVYVLDQDNGSQDLTRFHSYARRVKYITHRRAIKVHPNIISVLMADECITSYPGKGILPSLRSAQISSSTCDIIQTLLSLSALLLQLDLDLGFKPKASQFSEENIRGYLKKIDRTALGLERLSIRGSLPRDLMELVSSMGNLQALSLRLGSTLTIEAFTTITNFQHLSELELHAGHFDVDVLSDALRGRSLPTFPSLTKLNVRAQSHILGIFLDTLTTNTLHTLHIEAEEPTGVPTSWSPVFKMISDKATNSLQNLTIEHHIELDDLDVEDSSVDPPTDTPSTFHLGPKINTQIPYNDLRILASLGNLRQLVFDTTLPPDICDEELESLIKSWPELEHLNLGSIPTSTGVKFQARPPMTLRAVIALAATAVNLTTLVLPADIGQIETTPISVDARSQHTLKRITIGGPSIPDPLKLAPLLYRLFPSLEQVEGPDEHEIDWARTQLALQALKFSATPKY